MLLEILEDRNAVGLEERHLAGFDSVEELIPGVNHVVLDHHHRRGAHRAGDARPQRRRERREFELSALGFLEDAYACQRAEDAIERRCPDACGHRQLFDSAGTIIEKVRQFEFRGDVDQPRHPVSDNEVQHDGRWRRFLGHGGPPQI